MTAPDGHRPGPDGPPDPLPDELRRIIEEATRLVAALGGLPAGHVGDECRICPVCRMLAMLRELHPEVLDHLGAAAAELLAAAREFTATPGGAHDAGGPAGGGPAAGPAGPPGTARGPEGGVPDDVPLLAARPRTPSRPPVQHIEITD